MLRNAFVNARVNALESAALSQIANAEGVGLSEAVRLLIREAAKSRGLWPPARVSNETEVQGNANKSAAAKTAFAV